jgi:hypothetical protein
MSDGLSLGRLFARVARNLARWAINPMNMKPILGLVHGGLSFRPYHVM